MSHPVQVSRTLRRAVFALLVTLAPALAAAQTVSASEHFDRGIQLAREGDHRGALAEFRAAHDASQNPAVLFNLAATHENLNEYVEARELIERFQRLAPPAAVAQHRADIVAALARLSTRIGTLAVSADAPEAALEVDGVARREWREGLPLSVGRHRVAVTAPGRQPFRAEVEVLGGQRAEVRAALPRTRSSLQVSAEPVGSIVRLDGREIARAPVEGAVAVDEGRHVVEVSHPGYEPYRTEIDVTGVGARVAATLRWADPVPEREGAHLAIRTSEPSAHATLDGRRIALDGSVALPPGRHALRVEREAFLPVVRAVDLPLGQVTRLDLRLEPTPAYRDAVTGRARQMRTLGWVGVGAGAALLVGGGLWLGVAASQYADSSDTRTANLATLDQCTAGTIACPDARSSALFAENAAIDGRIDGELTATVVSGALTGVGLVGLVTGIVLLFNAPPGDRFERAPTWYLGVGPGGLGASGSF